LLLGAWRTWRLTVAALLSAMAFLVVLEGAAQADLFAITEVVNPGGDTDLARFFVGSGVRQSLPSSINTGAFELHPSLSPDGTKLAYWSDSPALGTTRIVVVDLAAGTSADLLNAFDALAIGPDDPSWVDNSHVVIGRGHQASGSGSFLARATPIDVTSFPTTPFPRGADIALGTFPANGRTLAVERRTVSANNQIVTVAGVRTSLNGVGQVVLGNGSARLGTGPGAGNISSYDHPTVSRSAGVIVVQHGGFSNNDPELQQLVFTDAGLQHPTVLPGIVNTLNASETRPEFSFDGRYLGFVRQIKTADPRLFVWDTDTQLLVNPDGVDLGPTSGTVQGFLNDDGNVAIGNAPLILNSAILANGFISFNLASFSNIGIIVQKVIGHTRVLGRPAPRLRFIGRVPLGRFRRGHGTIRWSRRVGGKRLAPGRYQITLRSVTKAGSVRDLGRPTLVRISGA
jgi:hypothetical protein